MFHWQDYVIYLMPIIGALIGWLTNFIAIKMLFHPRKPIPVFGFVIQGVFPKRQQVLAKKVGEVVATELISGQEIAEGMKRKAKSKELIDTIAGKIEEILTQKLPQVIPMVSMFLSPELVGAIKDLFVDEIKGMIDVVIDKIASGATENLNVQEVVEEKVTSFSSDKLEEILLSIMRRELKFVEIVGGVLGFLIGLSQMFLVVLSAA